MIKKKLFKSAVIITAVMLSVSGCAGGCGKQAEPVIADSVVETPEPEESLESVEPTPSPTVEPTEKPVEESEESTENEESTSVVEESTEEESSEESTGIEIVEELDKTMYAQTACNARSGDSTDFEKITSMSKGESVHVTGRTANDWYRVDWNNEVVYISSSLLGLEKPVVQQQSSGGGNGQQSGGGDSGGNQQSTGGGSEPNVGDTMFQDQSGHDVIYGGSFDSLDDL